MASICCASIKRNIIISIARAICEYSECFLRLFLSWGNSIPLLSSIYPWEENAPGITRTPYPQVSSPELYRLRQRTWNCEDSQVILVIWFISRLLNNKCRKVPLIVLFDLLLTFMLSKYKHQRMILFFNYNSILRSQSVCPKASSLFLRFTFSLFTIDIVAPSTFANILFAESLVLSLPFPPISPIINSAPKVLSTVTVSVGSAMPAKFYKETAF